MIFELEQRVAAEKYKFLDTGTQMGKSASMEKT